MDPRIPYTAVVQNIVPCGRHGPYAVATVSKIAGSVTFSLNNPTWREGQWPELGTIVVLTDMCKKRNGWRANEARYYQPDDE